MTAFKYPGFVEGQILRRDDLNGLRDYLADRDCALGRVVGFGVAGGLLGDVRTTGLHIGSGVAVDQNGQTLTLPADQILPLPAQTDDVQPPFDFVDPQVAGCTVVLVRTDVAEATMPCTETGCSGHSVMHDTGVDLLIVPGRLVPDGTDFSTEQLLTAVPLTTTTTGGISGSFAALRDLILARVGGLLPQITRHRLATMTTAGDKNAVALAKAAFLNEVLFAALDLLRFAALMDRKAVLETQTPGVALGWLHQVGATWTWDCSYRHGWEPQVGVALAMFGGTCGDPIRPWVQRLVSIIDTFVPPTIPPDDKPPIVIHPPFICRHYKSFIHDDCQVRPYPPIEIKPNWPEKWQKLPDWGNGPWNIPQPILPEQVYEIDTPDPVEFGVIDLVNLLGSDAVTTVGLLTEVIEKSGVTTAGVDALTADQARALPGFTFSGVAGPADRVVLIRSDVGRVVGTGRVPLTRSMRDLGVQLPAAVAAAATATTRASEAITKSTALDGKVATFEQVFVTQDAFQKAEQERNGWQAGVDRQFAVLDTRVKDQVVVQLAGYKSEFAAQVTPIVAESFKAFQGQLETVNGRVDALFSRGIRLPGVRETAASEALSGVLRSMRESVAAAAPDDRRDVVDEHLREVDLGLARIDAVTASGGSPLADSSETLTALIDSLVDGLRAAGASATSVNAIRRRATALRRTLTR